MTRSPATPDELHAAAVEVAESSVALYAAKHAKRKAWRIYSKLLDPPSRNAFIDAANNVVQAKRRHRAATQEYLAIRPEETT